MMAEEREEVHLLSRAKNFGEQGFLFSCTRFRHELSDYSSGDKFFQREFWKVFYVYEGCGFIVINQRRYPLRPGAVWLVHPDDKTTFLLQNEELQTCNVCFMPELFGDMLPDLCAENDFFTIFQRDVPLPPERSEALYSFDSGKRLLPLFKKLEDEYRLLRSNYREMIRAQLLELLILLSRSSKLKNRRNRSLRLVEHVDEFIREHYRDEISFDQLANQLEYSRNRLGIVYRARTGLTLTEALVKFRVETACRLLAGKDAGRIIEVCYLAGFHDLSYFHRQFRKWTGSTPKQYQLQKSGQ